MPEQYLDSGPVVSHPQRSVTHSYQEQQIVSGTQQVPSSMMAPQSEPSSLSSQPSSKSAGGKHVRVLDASGRDVRVGFDGVDHRPEKSAVQESSVSSQSRAPLSSASAPAAAASTNAYSDLEDIMAAMSEFDVSCLDVFQWNHPNAVGTTRLL